MSSIPQNVRTGITLQREINNASMFVYEAIERINKTQVFIEESADVFNFLYNLSVGFERVQKIVLHLLDIKESNDFCIKFNEKYHIHNHAELHNYIKGKEDPKLNETQIRLLNLLSDFYLNNRYGRYDQIGEYKFEAKELIHFVERSTGKKIEKLDRDCYKNDIWVKKFLTTQIVNLLRLYYNSVRNLSKSFNIYVDEAPSESRINELVHDSEEYCVR